MKRYFAIFIIGLLLSVPVFAFQAEMLTARNGLPGDKVVGVFQDRDDFVWVVAEQGIVRYDGYRFTPFPKQQSLRDSLQDISAFFIDSRGQYWLATADGIYLFDSDGINYTRFRHIDEDESTLSSNMVIKFYEDAKHRIWIATYNGVNLYQPDSGTFRRFHLAKNENTLRFVNVIIDIRETAEDKYWLAATQGIFELDLAKDKIEPIALPLADNLEVRSGSFYRQQNGPLWIGSLAGLVSYDSASGNARRFLVDPASPQNPANRIESIAQVSDEALWITTYDGAYEFDIANESFRALSFNPLLHGQYVGEIIKDTSGVVWIAGFAGLLKVTPQLINVTEVNRYSGHIPDFTELGVLSVLETSPSEIYIGTWGDGLYRLNLVTGESENFRYQAKEPDGINNDAIWSIYRDEGGLIWLGTGSGVCRFDPSTGRFSHRDNQADFPFKRITATVLSIVPDGHGNLWLATGLGLYLFDPHSKELTRFITTDDESSLSHNVIRSVFIDSLGNTWVATRNGFNLYHPETRSFTRYYPSDYKDGILSNSVIGLAELEPGTLLVALATEVYRFDIASGKSTPYRLDGARLGVVKLFVEDKRNDQLWMFGSAFAGYWDRKNQAIRNLSYMNDLRSASYIVSAGSAGDSGNIYLGSDEGLRIFKAQKIGYRSFSPKIRLTELLVDNKPPENRQWQDSPTISLAPDQQQLSFEMAALDYQASERVRYRYRLDGYEQHWNYRDADRRFVSYNNLKPGNYRLSVEGTNSDGLWSKKSWQMTVKVEPHWWQTWWASVLFVLLVAVSIILVIGMRTARIRRHSVELAEQVRQRTQKISRQKQTIESLLKRKDEFFANVSHEFRTPLSLILGPVESALNHKGSRLKTEHLKLIRRNAKRLLRMVDQLMAFSRLDAPQHGVKGHTAVTRLIPLLVNSFDSLAQRQSIGLKYRQVEQPVWVPLSEDVVEKIVLNLLSNAFKYTPDGGAISCRLEIVADGQVCFSVKDTGIGIAKADQAQVFERFGRLTAQHHEDIPGAGIGLALVKSLVEAGGGRIELDSDAGQGACFRVYLPQEAVQGEDEPEATAVVNQVALELECLESAEDEQKAVGDVPPCEEQRTSILVIEDNVDMRQYIAQALSSHHRIVQAGNGAQGLAMAQAEVPDLIISDIMMPELDGYSLCKALKEDQATSHIPVILLTALSDKDSRKKGWQQQADDYLAKPFDSEELNLRVDNLLLLRDMLKQRYGAQMLTSDSEVSHLQNESSADDGLSDRDKAFLTRLAEFMEGHYADEALSVGVVAEHMAMAERQLRRKLKALLNCGPAEYVRTFRLKKAAHKMLTGEQIQMAALDAGFSSYSTFIASFKALYGMSPSEYLSARNAGRPSSD